MIKANEIKNPNSCINKAADDEMVFVLRAQDATAPKSIIQWIASNFETCSNDKLREAFEAALAMKNHKGRKMPN